MPAIRFAPRRYHAAMIVVHWLTAGSIVTVVVLAWLFPEGKAVDSSAVVGLHVAAALFHLVVRRDGVMARMLPGAQLTPPLPAAAVRPGVR